PTSISTDPVTELSKLFQQGIPLCLLYNAAFPNAPIKYVASDDIKSTKSNILGLSMAYQSNKELDPSLYVSASEVLLDSTHDLLKIMKLVNSL
ncbi:hypothetical protein FK518_30940, partial [Klebsiella pneumoniae]|nr:hypothetical protein [Klebsiella pneumoniae]